MSQPVKDYVKDIFGLTITHGHDLYLGLPTFTLSDKKLQFTYLKDRVAKKIDNWATKHFSEGGKEVLIKSVLQSMPTYAMTCFRIPTSICDLIEKLCAQFWWGGSSTERKLPWISWEDLCKSKDEGGVGFRKLTLFNKAMLAKQAWRIISSPNSLVARVLKARYFKHTDVMEAGIGSNPSFVWRSLCWWRGVLNGGMFWHLDKGEEVLLFSDKWVPNLPGGKPLTRIATNSKVATYITEDGQWDLGLLNQAFLPFEVDKIRQVHIANNGEGDTRYWKDDLKGKYSVKSGYLQEATLDKLRRDKGKPRTNRACRNGGSCCGD